MAIGDISAFAPIIKTLTTTVELLGTVPMDEEWTLRFMRAVCMLTSGTSPTVSVGLTAAANELCFNEVVPIPNAAVNGAKNILGPDFITLPGGTPIYGRSSNSVRLTITGTRKKVA